MVPHRLPLWLKLAYSAFVAVLVPAYWRTYGPANFLYYCDVAALVTLAGLWLESPLLLGTQAVAILVPQAVWCADLASRLLGFRLLGLTNYMFNPAYPRWVRAVSLYHGWLPLLLLWAVRRVGYDRRSLGVQVALGLAVLLVCYTALAPPGATGGPRPAVNVNYVFGPDDKRQQTFMPPLAWLAVVAAVAVAGMFLPAHLLLRRVAPRPTGAA